RHTGPVGAPGDVALGIGIDRLLRPARRVGISRVDRRLRRVGRRVRIGRLGRAGSVSDRSLPTATASTTLTLPATAADLALLIRLRDRRLRFRLAEVAVGERVERLAFEVPD